MNFDEIQSLRDAIKASPESIPLRKLLANALMKNERWEEAEIEIKDTLQMAPNDLQVKVALAQTFYELGKISTGLVLVEELVDLERPPARAYLILAKLLLKTKDAEGAKDAYKKATIIDASLKDTFLESEINMKVQEGVTPEPEKIKLGGKDEENFDDDDSYLDIERPKTSFEDVGGMDQLKEEIRMKIIHPLEHPEIYKAYGKKIGGGILMYGPPGCGKTHLARATAGEINANFIPVGISDILDMYIGQSERNLHAIFDKARKLKPCVLFFDEVDALGANRTDMKNSAGKHVINQFLAEMDGVQYDNDGILVLAATNAPWHLDPAFRRPGRFDRIIFVPPPDDIAKKAILEIKLKEKPTEKIDYQRVIKKAKDFSGADLEAVIDIAIESKLEEAMKSGIPTPLSTKDLEGGVKKHRATTKEWFNTAKNYALFANDSGLYDDILKFMNL
ncbi:MAG: AAA family ATPase [Saprospiraceae bacterium]|nr:AAA family ATPase [Saprospiraceae bacterium]MDG2418585.1 AAA family ATPase [Saprospiraceae bacterium]